MGCAVVAAIFLAGTGAAAAASLPHLALEVTLDPAARRLEAVATLDARETFAFALYRSLAVTGVAVDGRPAKAVATAANGALREWRISAPPAGARLRIEYSGTLPVLDAALTYRSVLRELPPMAAPSGTFLPEGSGWYPAPAERFTYSVSLSLPAGQRGLVPGDLAAETVPKAARGRYTAHFEFRHPAEGIALMAGPYVVRETLVPRKDQAPLRLRTYFFADLDPLASGYLEDSRRYLELYSRQIGAYPFQAFSVVASPLPTGFGMPTLTYLGAQVLKLPFIRATSLGHEVLHNWWGNGVYVDYARGNWSEGLTTFMADYRYKEDESEAAARAMRLAWLRDFAAVPAGARQPLVAFRARVHGAEAAVGYGKSAMVFFMLRDRIGTDAFHRGVRLFWENNRFRAASWDDLRAAFEQASGQKLAAFFRQWIERAGAPQLAIAQARAQHLDGKSRLAITLVQASPAYSLTVPLRVMLPERSELHLVSLSEARTNVAFEVDGVPTAVKLDPELRLWRALDPHALPPILREWILASAPRVLIASRSKEFREAAHALSAAFFEAPARTITPSEALRGSQPVLIVGLDHDVDTLLAKLSLPPAPASVDRRGSGRVWTIYAPQSKRAERPPIAAISVRDAPALRAMQRPLPHYGGQSHLAFDGSRVIQRGVWPWHAEAVPITRRD